ncbi:MAG: hypothetical protein P4L86_17895 [Mycobacterium sp.]|nr:hypothetical protein [Mycobacterium sp.]
MSVSDEDAQEIRETETAHAVVNTLDDVRSVVVFGVRTPTGHRVAAVSKDLYNLMFPPRELGDDLAAIMDRASLIPQDLWILGPTYKSFVHANGRTYDVKIEPFMAPGVSNKLHYRVDLAADNELWARFLRWWDTRLSKEQREHLKRASDEPTISSATKALLDDTDFPLGAGIGDQLSKNNWQWPMGLREFIQLQ